MAVATIYTELDIDLTKFQAKQRKLLDDIKKVGADSETALQRSFMNLGVTSDSVYKLMVEKARVSYEQIATSGKASTAEQVRAQQAMVAQINAINAKMAEGANAHYTTLGMKSAASINEQIANVTKAATAQQLIVGKSSEDWIRIERAKNEKLKELNKEMTGEHEMSMASMTRAVLRFYAAFYVASAALTFFKDILMSGIKAIDDMKVSTIGVAAQITTMQGTTGNVVENYKNNLIYAKALIPVLMQIDANSFANLSQIQKMNMAMSMQGTILDLNKAKQVESFTALSNAVALFTQGQDKEKQASQEIRALFTGQIREGNMVALQMDQMIRKTGEYKDGLKGLLAEGEKHKDTLERMQPYLIGIVTASKDIQDTWSAVSSSLETSWNIIQRKMFAGIYADMVKYGQDLTAWLRDADNGMYRLIDRIMELGRAIKSLYNLLPEGTGTAATYGIIGGLLFGSTPVGATIAALSIIIDKLKTVEWIQAQIAEKAKQEAAFADVAAGVMAKRSGLFGGGTSRGGVTRDFGITTPDVGKGAPDAEAAKKADEEYFKRWKEKADFDDKVDRENLQRIVKTLHEEERLRKEGESLILQGEANYFEQLKAQWAVADKLDKDNLKRILDNLKQEEEYRKFKESSQKELPPEDRKMVTFYQDMVGMEDEYRQAKLDWIEKEAAVKFAGMDKEIAKERWMRDQRIKFEQEIFDAKAKNIQQGLGDMSSMFQSLSGMYDKNSGEYARLQEAANAMIILQKAVAVVNAVSAVAAAAAAPFPAGFVAMASMAAAMGSLLGSIGLSIGGGSAQGVSAAYGQNTTVFGGANNQASESIGNTWKLLEDTYDLQKHTLTGIYDNMKQLNANITGIVKGIVQGGVGGGGIDLAGNSAVNIHGGVMGIGLLPAMATLLVDKLLGTTITENIGKLIYKIPFIGGVLNRVSSTLFGGNEQITGSGLAIGAGGKDVRSYTRTDTEGGWFSSGRSDYYAGAVNEELTNLFSGPQGIYTTLKSGISGLAVILGGDTKIALEKEFAAMEINLAGLDSDAINKKLSEVISGISDTYAKEVFGSLVTTYQKVGEGAFETVSRLAIDLLSVTDLLGMTAKSTTINTVALSESLIELAGGLDKLQSAADTYYDKFFTDSEKQARIQLQLADSLGAVPGSRVDYRRTLEALNLTNTADQEKYVLMLKLADIADQYYSTLETETEKATKANEDYVASLKNISLSIDAWLNNLSLSDLSPVQSADNWSRQYAEAKAKASASGATEQSVNDYLSFATKYLEFQKAYGTANSYKAIYDAVVSDVAGMGTGETALAIQKQQLAALNTIATNTGSALIVSQASQSYPNVSQASQSYPKNENGVYTMPDGRTYYVSSPGTVNFLADDKGNTASTFTIPDATLQWYKAQIDAGSDVERYRGILGNFGIKYASGGYADSPSIFGERGGEWAVPTYEPQRKNFLKSAPKSFWDNLGLNGGSNGGDGGEVTVHSHIYLDGKEIQTCVTKGLKTNLDLRESVRRAVN